MNDAPQTDHDMVLRILVADDDPLMRQIIQTQLIQMGHEVIQASNGLQAIHCIASQTIDLVLLDLVMPEHDGFEVLDWIRAHHPDRWFPVIVISANDTVDLVVRALNTGADDYMTKPVHHRILIGKINNYRDRLKIQRTNESLLAFVEQQKAELQERIDRESWVAARIQNVLLMSNLRQHPNHLSIAARAEAATNVNGDFMDVLPLTNDIVDVVLGDVMGKGVPAALMAAEVKQQIVKTLVEQVARSGEALCTPQELVNLVHQSLTPKLIELDSFVTLVYLRLDTARQQVTFVSCGHLPPLLVSHAGTAELGESQLPIGILPDETYHQATYPFLPGDALVLSSDGLVEAQNPSNELYGQERLAHTAQNAHRFCQTPGALLEALRAHLNEFCESRRVLDDLSMMVIKSAAASTPSVDRVFRRSTHRSLDELTPLRQAVTGFLTRHHVPPPFIDNVNLVVVELLTNIIRHSSVGFPNALVEFECLLTTEGLEVVIESTGPRFESDQALALPDLDLSTEGGFGLYIVQSLTSRFSQQHAHGINQVRAFFALDAAHNRPQFGDTLNGVGGCNSAH
jgi:sigma-B regulation protein RsbU (phosphoserine phosphatase)